MTHACRSASPRSRNSGRTGAGALRAPKKPIFRRARRIPGRFRHFQPVPTPQFRIGAGRSPRRSGARPSGLSHMPATVITHAARSSHLPPSHRSVPPELRADVERVGVAEPHRDHAAALTGHRAGTTRPASPSSPADAPEIGRASTSRTTKGLGVFRAGLALGHREFRELTGRLGDRRDPAARTCGDLPRCRRYRGRRR